jgi:hypothetical protein
MRFPNVFQYIFLPSASARFLPDLPSETSQSARVIQLRIEFVIGLLRDILLQLKFVATKKGS